MWNIKTDLSSQMTNKSLLRVLISISTAKTVSWWHSLTSLSKRSLSINKRGVNCSQLWTHQFTTSWSLHSTSTYRLLSSFLIKRAKMYRKISSRWSSSTVSSFVSTQTIFLTTGSFKVENSCPLQVFHQLKIQCWRSSKWWIGTFRIGIWRLTSSGRARKLNGSASTKEGYSKFCSIYFRMPSNLLLKAQSKSTSRLWKQRILRMKSVRI